MQTCPSDSHGRKKLPAENGERSYYFVFDKFPTLPNGKIDAVNLKKTVVKMAADLKQQA